MIKGSFKNYRFSDDKKRLAYNFFSLSTLQGLNMIMPLVTLPYLVRVLGVENFGLVNLVLSIIMYFNILVSFGFELSATREISIHRDNINKVSEIFSAVMFIKALMLIVSLIVLSILILFIDTFREHATLYYATFGIVLGNLLFPSWFFQGMERMKYITYVGVISKAIFTGLIFVFIKKEADFIYVPVLNSLGAIIGGCYALWLVYKLFSVKIVLPKKKLIISQFKDSFHFFLSRLANNGSRYFATTIIGLYFGNLIVGYYTMVEKLFYAIMSLGSIVSQTIYPYMSRTKNIVFFKKILITITIVSLLIVIPIIYYNELILLIIFDEQNQILSNIFIIVISGVIFAIVSSLLGYPLLAAFGYIKYANNSLIIASILYLAYTFMVVFLTTDIYFVAAGIPIYMIIGLGLRVYYIRKTKLLFDR